MINKFVLAKIIFFVIFSFQCRQDKTQRLPAVEVQVQDAFIQFMGEPIARLERSIDSILNLDRRFTDLVASYILDNKDSSQIHRLFVSYFTDSSRVRLKDTCLTVFRELDWQKALGLPFARYKHAFPERDVPAVYTLISDFNYGIFLFEDDQGKDALGIGIEMFTGNTDLYDQLSVQNPNFSSYLNRTFNLNHLPSKIIQALLGDLIPPPASNRMLDHMIREGKILYLTQALLPGIPDTVLHEYSGDQMQWVLDNEWDVWRFLLAEKLLFNSTGKDIINLVQPSPHSQGMPREAPGRAVNVVGMKMIESFMKREPMTLVELAGYTDAEQILQKAAYKPR